MHHKAPRIVGQVGGRGVRIGPHIAVFPAGDSPIMKMGTWAVDVDPERNGAFANLVIVHEFGHGVSIRLAGGPACHTCLGATGQGQATGMAEGWSDWWSLMFTQKPSDAQFDADTTGSRLIGKPEGIRNFPSSFDMTIHPMTYGWCNNPSWPNTALGREARNAGEIWASALWDMAWLSINKQEYDPDLYGGTGGNNLALQSVMDGLKLQPISPPRA